MKSARGQSESRCQRLTVRALSHRLVIWEKETEGIIAEMFSNKFQKVLSSKEKLNNTLFDTPNRKEVYLLTEFKQLDFIIKVNDRITLNKIRSALQKLSNIALHYTIENDKIQNQLHLIFD